MADKPTDCGYAVVNIPTENPSRTPATLPAKDNRAPMQDPKGVQTLGPRLKQVQKK